MKRTMIAAAAALLMSMATAHAMNSTVYGNTVRDVYNQLVSGTHTVLLTVYDASTGGTAQWSQYYTSVSFSSGVFSLANITLPSMYFDSGYYLALSVDDTGLAEIAERKTMSSDKKGSTLTINWDVIVN